MSTLKTNTLTGTTSAGSIVVTGEGGSTTTNLQQGLAKAWINLDGTGTIGTNDSFNTGSITDNGTGDYSITITNDMNNAFYSFTFGDYTADNNSGQLSGSAGNEPAAGSIRVQGVKTGNTVDDTDQACITIHGDLA
tara:strand:- start:28 stop:435 length:408 start_codon:yes stop_codon:yes gene_type:complete